ncbi:amino acid adenylation protein [Corynebacterium sp. HMSC08F01]|uniref:Pls/PosA family non-ribosomal peptide synthetase n=1 Tax=Corynebacterium sp. HMSC08F01 TaxID=1581139 RepID=UPI0008A2823B|nr:Pls/PosA family non-ribosomal peptide synthetase [Corynebacterium sp. HMSC08F01]OFT29999.1 amino acid adenylation protein [Corynebacterium sp. HMSC08F01]
MVQAEPLPNPLLRSHLAPPERTLIDVLFASAEAHPGAAAIDDGEVITYAELVEEIEQRATAMRTQGVPYRGRVGIRMTSGTRELYLAILSTMRAGCAYVPVDADDPDERAETVFTEADVDAIWTDAGLRMVKAPVGGGVLGGELGALATVTPDDDCWIIFTSGSTGKPKGVAVTHRSAAAFVDAEARLFCQDEPLGPDDRVLAGLSVAFDASCEEMWLAWRHGACLVPAPRALVRSGQDLGPWLIRRDITVVSTVPTLAGLWPKEALDNIRLLIVGGEACSQELTDRLADGREMWNTYGPTEATVVASATRLFPGKPVTIGWPLDGWDLAIASDGEGEAGELIIGGVGLARYLDPEKDAEKYAPMGDWERAYRTGDHVRLTEDGLAFIGRADDQVKIGGRRIELGEVEANVAALEGVYNSAVAVQTLPAGDKVLVGYVSPDDGVSLDVQQMRERLAEVMPAALVPRIHVMDELPIRTSGKVDKKALPWPLPASVDAVGMTPTEQWVAEAWVAVLGLDVPGKDADFFELGGSSLAAASLIARLRERVPTIAVRDLYDHPRLETLASLIDDLTHTAKTSTRERSVAPVSGATRLAQTLLMVPVMTLKASAAVTWVAIVANVLGLTTLSWTWLAVAFAVLCTPLGRIPIGALGARAIRGRIAPGVYPRGGSQHLRLWAAERWLAASGAMNIASANAAKITARLLGNTVGKDVDMHAFAPVTGLATIGEGAAIEPGVDLGGTWLDGDELHVGTVVIGPDARVGARSTLMPGTEIREGAHVEAGSTVTGDKPVKKHARWAGSPARKKGRSKHRFPNERPPRRPMWALAYGLTSLVLSVLPALAVLGGAAATLGLARVFETRSVWGLLVFAPVGGVVYIGLGLALTWAGVRLAQLGVQPGVFPVRSLRGWSLWTVTRLMDDARTRYFPIYAGAATPVWLRLLGAHIGEHAEVSTAVMVPKLTEVREGAFLADDTLAGGYEIGGGWIRTDHAVVGKRSFVGNSGMVAPGRKLAKHSLVAVLSASPKKSKAHSNWWGSPPERMRRVEVESAGEATYEPTKGLVRRRGVVETMRLLAPMTQAVLATLFAACVVTLLERIGWWTYLLGGLTWMGVGVVAVASAVVAKWVLVGKHRAGEHPLYSWFVWLNELQDQFIEVIAAPWFFNWATGSGEMNLALRALGVHIGPGAWVESYWFPETDLCSVGAGATVGPGTVVQTHLFQDRVMSLDTVTIEASATLGAHSVSLPGSVIGAGATVGPGSLVMRGDEVPANTVWQGNPVEPR